MSKRGPGKMMAFSRQSFSRPNAHADAASAGIIGNPDKRTRVDGKGLWRSWKRNFKTKHLALLDLIDNSLDAAILGGQQQQNAACAVDGNAFTGRLHVYPDLHNDATTGLCILNNCAKPIRPLQRCLQAYDSSKVNSGAKDIGQNGVGLKQGAATLSDLSFVLVKNGSNGMVELGIIAQSLQREEGPYLPAFQFSNDDEASIPLNHQMVMEFSKPNNADVRQCIETYGYGTFLTGVERLCLHFDKMCTDSNFQDSPYVFMVILNNVHQRDPSEMNNGNTWEGQQKYTIEKMMNKLKDEAGKTYLHVPDSFDFRIDNDQAEFKYWPERLIELSVFNVTVNSKIPWKEKLQPSISIPGTYHLRIFAGFDGYRITDHDAKKEGSLYVYSRQSGRLISCTSDARSLLRLNAGGTTFCQGLTVIIDDSGGNLPLNPTKQEIAFGEEDHGSTHKENLYAWVGCITQFYYNYHLDKYDNKKKVLTEQLQKLGGNELIQKNRQLRTLDDSILTEFMIGYRAAKGNIRHDKSLGVQQVVGSDTLYQLEDTRETGGKKRKEPTSQSSYRGNEVNVSGHVGHGQQAEEDMEHQQLVEGHGISDAQSSSRTRRRISRYTGEANSIEYGLFSDIPSEPASNLAAAPACRQVSVTNQTLRTTLNKYETVENLKRQLAEKDEKIKMKDEEIEDLKHTIQVLQNAANISQQNTFGRGKTVDTLKKMYKPPADC